MKNLVKISIYLCLLLFTTSGLYGQGLRSSYFLSTADYRHQLNPAFMGDRNYISLPGIGNLNIGVQSNMGLSDFIYKYDDPNGKYDLTTFMSSTVDADKFLSKLQSKNKIENNIDLTVLSFGFFGMKGYNTFEINIHSRSQITLPYELFSFMKLGASSGYYQIRDLQVVSSNYAEIAIGHSQPINDKLTIGAKLKGLVGLGYADANITQMDLNLNGDTWEITANGTLDASVKDLEFETDTKDKGQEITGFDVDNPGINGWGLATDLGAIYKLNNQFTFSASLTDLGFINWAENIHGTTRNDPFTFDGFENIEVYDDDDDESTGNSLDDQFDDLGDDLEDLTKFYAEDGKSSKSRMLSANLNLGAEYLLPFYQKASLGFLSSTRFDKVYTWTEGRLFLNWNPGRCFEASVNYGISNLSSSLGWMLNFHQPGLSFFLGSDRMITKVNSDYIPVNDASANIVFGMNVTFGHRKKTEKTE